ncbi:MAG: UMP kinase [Clostridia bacterium]|nr:UMP kinase [Clostridia bacterium]
MSSYKRVILKLSGEALGENGRLFDQKLIAHVGRILAEISRKGIELGIVIGAGNIWRGRQSQEMDAVTADHMGMLGTVINCLCMRDAVERAGAKAVVFSAIDMPRVCEPYNVQSARQAMRDGNVVFFAGGSGNPFFTTDTAVVLRAAEMQADALLLAKNIDGVYDDDPRKNPEARLIPDISYNEALGRRLKVMDTAAFAMLTEQAIPTVRVFGLAQPEDILRVLDGDPCGTVLHP